MKYIEDLRDMLCEELDKISEKGELTAGSLETIDKLTHSIKSIDTIMAMEEAGYSNDMAYTDGGNYNYSRARGRNRDSMGRYSRNSYARGGRGGRGYSRDDKEDMIEKLEDMMEEARDSKTKEAIKKAIHQIGE